MGTPVVGLTVHSFVDQIAVYTAPFIVTDHSVDDQGMLLELMLPIPIV